MGLMSRQGRQRSGRYARMKPGAQTERGMEEEEAEEEEAAAVFQA